MGALAQRATLSSPLDVVTQQRHDVLDVVHHRFRAEAKDLRSVGLEDLASPLVVAPLVSVDRAVDFDCEPELRAVEVDDESRQDVLAAKLVAFELAPSQALPELGLGLCRAQAHLSGMMELGSSGRPRPAPSAGRKSS
jgi:hypothetical protein